MRYARRHHDGTDRITPSPKPVLCWVRAVIVMDETTCMVKAWSAFLFLLRILRPCTPCREGTGGSTLVNRIETARPLEDLDRLVSVSNNIQATYLRPGRCAALRKGHDSAFPRGIRTPHRTQACLVSGSIVPRWRSSPHDMIISN